MSADPRRVSSAMRLFRALAAYCTILTFGITLWTPYVPHLATDPVGARFVNLFYSTICFSMPALTGFFLRVQIGPYLTGHRLSPKWLQLCLPLFLTALSLEALHSFLMSGSLATILNWQVLSFLAVCVFVTFLILTLDKRFMAIAALAVFIQYLSFHNFRLLGETPAITTLEPQISQNFLAALWASVFGILVFWISHRFNKIFQLEGTLGPFYFNIFGIVLGITAFLWGKEYILTDSRGLLSFYELPRSIFLPNLRDDNYWAFVPFFPIFAFGFVLRDFLSSPYFKSYAILIFLGALMGCSLTVGFTWDFLCHSSISSYIFTKEAFMIRPAFVILSVCFPILIFAVFYKSNFLSEGSLLGRFCDLHKGLLVLYLVHSCLFVWTSHWFPFEKLEALTTEVKWVPWLVYGVAHLIYLLSLFISHSITRWLEERASSGRNFVDYESNLRL